MLDFDLIPKAPFAIAFSGGGDSTALVHMLRNHHPRPFIIIVNHNLREGSYKEAQKAAAWARHLGLEVEIMSWIHNRPTSAIQEKARDARYHLLGEACRQRGITHLLTAHTQDDQAETLLMRYDRNTGWRGAAGMSERVYGAVWPALAQIHLIRPLLTVSRAELRAYNQEHDLGWIDDPSNEDRRFSRILARDYLSHRAELSQRLVETGIHLSKGRKEERVYLRKTFNRFVKIDPFGCVEIKGQLPPILWGMILQAASGRGASLHSQKLRDLVLAVSRNDFGAATLGGAYICRRGQSLWVGPEPSVYKGRRGSGRRAGIKTRGGSQSHAAMTPQSLEKDRSIIWDGRFEIIARQREFVVMTAAQALKGMNQKARGSLIQYLPPSPFRGAMPVIMDGDEMVWPRSDDKEYGDDKSVEIYTLVASRLHETLTL